MTQPPAAPTDRRAGVQVLPAKGATVAVVLVLHGGRANSLEPSEPEHLSRRRLNPIARAVHAQCAEHGVAVWKVEYRLRGWNGTSKDPAHDAQWALEEIRRRHGGIPVVLLGHSMGGRAAVQVLGDPSVVGMVALCPWLPDEPYDGACGKRVVIAHAVVDRWTSPRETRHWAKAASAVAESVVYVRVRRSGHFMLRRARVWSDLATGFTLSFLGLTPSVGRATTKALAAAAAGVTSLSV